MDVNSQHYLLIQKVDEAGSFFTRTLQEAAYSSTPLLRSVTLQPVSLSALSHSR